MRWAACRPIRQSVVLIGYRVFFKLEFSMERLDELPPSFTMLHDKQMSSSEVVLASWCPTMDLLSILTDDNQLTVYRLDFQRVWIACPDKPITAIAWRPDGEERARSLTLVSHHLPSGGGCQCDTNEVIVYHAGQPYVMNTSDL